MNIDRVASIADILIGAWLFFSLFLVRDVTGQMAIAALVGAASIGLGYLSLWDRPWARWIVAGLAVWLFVSVFTTPGLRVATIVNHSLVATLLFGFSALPTGRANGEPAFGIR